MSNFRKILRAFLASPSDLTEERQTVRETVNEFNEYLADAFGCQVELIGWEDTVAGYGRPQHLINKDVKRCDLFIGLIWKRWGTRPDDDGHFSSGFHEEFGRSIARREKSGCPEIALFLKDISDEYLRDPGEDLKRVIDFRQTITADRRILFQKFSTLSDLKPLVWKRLIEFVRDVKADEAPKRDEIRTKDSEHAPEEEYVENRGAESSPLSAEGYKFLQNLVGRFGDKNAFAELSTSHIARFRLLANSVTKAGNQEMYVGVHDLNLLLSAYIQGMDSWSGSEGCRCDISKPCNRSKPALARKCGRRRQSPSKLLSSDRSQVLAVLTGQSKPLVLTRLSAYPKGLGSCQS